MHPPPPHFIQKVAEVEACYILGGQPFMPRHRLKWPILVIGGYMRPIAARHCRCKDLRLSWQNYTCGLESGAALNMEVQRSLNHWNVT